MEIDEEMKDRGMLRLERMFDRIERNILKRRYGICKRRGNHSWYTYNTREICDSCWRDSYTINEEPTPEDTRRGLMKARERFRIGLNFPESSS